MSRWEPHHQLRFEGRRRAGRVATVAIFSLLLAAGAVTAVVFNTGSHEPTTPRYTVWRPEGRPVRRPPVYWTLSHAERSIRIRPPKAWRGRGYLIADVTCSGLKHVRSSRHRDEFSDFSCEITIVSHTRCGDSAAGTSAPLVYYQCRVAFQSTAINRTLHPLDGIHYALYRG